MTIFDCFALRFRLAMTRDALSLRGVPLHGFGGELFGKPKSGSLSTIVRSYKSAVTKDVHARGLLAHRRIWQPSFYDHIIRDDADYFFVQQYIEINPLLWYLDTDNPDTHGVSIDELRQTLHVKHHLEGFVLERAIEYELAYRTWWTDVPVTIED